MRSVSIVSLRTAASAVTPMSPRPLTARLCERGVGWETRGERVVVSMGADRKGNKWGAAAHFRLVICVWLRMAASAVALMAPMQFS